MGAELDSGHTEIVVLVKAAPQVGQRHGETVCCAGVDPYGAWVRLYPVSFRSLDEGQKFARWDRIAFKWRRPKDDPRIESKRLDQGSLRILGSLPRGKRSDYLANLIVTDLSAERKRGRSLALLEPRSPSFFVEEKSSSEVDDERKHLEAAVAQADLFNAKPLVPYQPCPYRFKYKYLINDRPREGTCQDWELEATFFKWQKIYGSERAIREMTKAFGDEYPNKGMLFAMGTHSIYPDTWLINGVIRYDTSLQIPLL